MTVFYCGFAVINRIYPTCKPFLLNAYTHYYQIQKLFDHYDKSLQKLHRNAAHRKAPYKKTDGAKQERIHPYSAVRQIEKKNKQTNGRENTKNKIRNEEQNRVLSANEPKQAENIVNGAKKRTEYDRPHGKCRLKQIFVIHLFFPERKAFFLW